MNKKYLIFMLLLFVNVVASNQSDLTYLGDEEISNSYEVSKLDEKKQKPATKIDAKTKHAKSKHKMAIAGCLLAAALPFTGACSLLSLMLPATSPYVRPEIMRDSPRFTVVENRYVGLTAINFPHEQITSVSALPSNKLLLACGRHLRIFDLATNQVVQGSDVELNIGILCTAVSHNGKFFAIAGNDSFFAVLDIDNYANNRPFLGETLGVPETLDALDEYKIKCEDSGYVHICPESLSFSHDDRFVAISGIDIDNIYHSFIFDCETKKFLEIPFKCRCLKFNPQNSAIAAFINDRGKICTISLSNPDKILLSSRSNDWMSIFIFSTDGNHILATNKNNIYDYDLRDRTCANHPLSSLGFWGYGDPPRIEYSQNGARILVIFAARVVVLDSQNFNSLYDIFFSGLFMREDIKTAFFSCDDSKIIVVLSQDVIILSDLLYEAEKNRMRVYLRSDYANSINHFVNHDIFEYLCATKWNGYGDGHDVSITVDLHL